MLVGVIGQWPRVDAAQGECGVQFCPLRTTVNTLIDPTPARSYIKRVVVRGSMAIVLYTAAVRSDPRPDVMRRRGVGVLGAKVACTTQLLYISGDI